MTKKKKAKLPKIKMYTTEDDPKEIYQEYYIMSVRWVGKDAPDIKIAIEALKKAYPNLEIEGGMSSFPAIKEYLNWLVGG